jgi:hypothetical protein
MGGGEEKKTFYLYTAFKFMMITHRCVALKKGEQTHLPFR